MQKPGALTCARLKTLRAARMAGIVFAVLLIATLVTISKTIRRK
jgi:hypothetical protein